MIKIAATVSVRRTRVVSFPLATLLLFSAAACSSDDSTVAPGADTGADTGALRDAASDRQDGRSGDADASVTPDVRQEAAVLTEAATGDDAPLEAGSPETSARVEAGEDASPDTSQAAEASDTADAADAGRSEGDASDALSIDALSIDAEAAAEAQAEAGETGLRLVGYWKFDELTGTAVADSSGHGNDGVLTSGAALVAGGTTSAQFSNPGSLQLDGAGGTAVLNVNGLPPVDAPKTISVWLNYTAITGPNQTVVALTNSAAACGVQLGIRGGSIAISSWGGGTLVNNNGAPAAGSWHNIVYTFDGTTHSLYVDGAPPVTRVTAPQSCSVAENVLGTYATHAPPYDEFYRGMIDDLRIYSGVLGAAQIAAIAAGGDPSVISADAGVEAAAEAAAPSLEASTEAAADARADGGATDGSTPDGATADSAGD